MRETDCKERSFCKAFPRAFRPSSPIPRHLFHKLINMISEKDCLPVKVKADGLQRGQPLKTFTQIFHTFFCVIPGSLKKKSIIPNLIRNYCRKFKLMVFKELSVFMPSPRAFKPSSPRPVALFTNQQLSLFQGPYYSKSRLRDSKELSLRIPSLRFFMP